MLRLYKGGHDRELRTIKPEEGHYTVASLAPELGSHLECLLVYLLNGALIKQLD